MKKRNLIADFFDDDFSTIDRDTQDPLDKFFSGAKQCDLSMRELMEGISDCSSKKAISYDSPVPANDTPADNLHSKKESVVYEELLLQHLQENFTIRKYGNLPYIRRGFVWLPVSEEVVGALLMESLPKNLKDNFRSGEARHVTQRIMFANAFQEDSLVLPKNAMLFRNGCFDVLTQEKIIPPENWFFPFEIHADYDPDCTMDCPVFDRFMAQISNHDDDTHELFMAFLAYSLMPGAPLKKIFVLGPEHDTGKSLLSEWLQHYAGEEQTTSIPLERFYQHFALADIVGKSLVFSMELPADPLSSKATIVAKNISGHDKIQIQQKYMKAFKYAPHAKIICGTNHPVRSNDLPFWRRILVLPCLNPIPPSEQDDELLEKLFAEEEAIMVKIMDAARAFVMNGMEFPYCAASLEVKRDWQRNNVPHLARFIEDRCVFDPDARTWSEDLHDAFVDYCADRNSNAPTTKALVDALKIGWPELRHDRWAENGRQGRGFYGIRIR